MIGKSIMQIYCRNKNKVHVHKQTKTQVHEQKGSMQVINWR